MRYYLMIGIWLIAGIATTVWAQPPVLVQMKKAATPDGVDLERIDSDIKSALRRNRLTVLTSAEATTARWRIDVSGTVDKCPIDASKPRYTLTLAAFDLKSEEYIAFVKAAPNCLDLPIDELATRAVAALFDNRAFERDRTAFFEKIRQYFSSGSLAATAPADTAGPAIEVYSPALPRGFRPVGKVSPNVSVEITGRVTDPSNVKRLSLNGQAVSFDEQGIFRPTVQMAQSDYRIQLEAEDAVGNHRSLEFTLAPQSLTTAKSVSAEPVAEKRLALVIGNSAYEHVTRLTNPVNDAEAMAIALSSLDFEVIKRINVDRKTFIQAINEFGSRLANEKFNVGLVYYAGHGVQHKGLNYLVPVEVAMNSDAETDFVEVQRIMNQMEAANSRTNILILDACRDDPFRNGRTLGSSYGPPATMQAPVGTLIAFATAPGRTAADGTGQNGIYTEALLKHLQTPRQPVADMFLKVRQEVMQKTKNEQIPWESTSLTDHFYFRR